MLPAVSFGRRAAGVAVLAVALAGCVQVISGGAPPVKGSGVVKSESRPVAGFSAVSLTGIGKLVVEVTGKESLTIKAEDNILPLLTSEVKDGTLTLGVKPDSNINPTQPIEYHVEVKDLTGLTVSGTGNAEARGVKAGRLTVQISGTGNVTVAGTTDELDVSVTGTGKFNGEGLPAKQVTAQVTGTGNAVVQASERLTATVTGIGSVEYIGDPKQLTQSVTGLGKVKKR